MNLGADPNNSRDARNKDPQYSLGSSISSLNITGLGKIKVPMQASNFEEQIFREDCLAAKALANLCGIAEIAALRFIEKNTYSKDNELGRTLKLIFSDPHTNLKQKLQSYKKAIDSYEEWLRDFSNDPITEKIKDKFSFKEYEELTEWAQIILKEIGARVKTRENTFGEMSFITRALIGDSDSENLLETEISDPEKEPDTETSEFEFLDDFEEVEGEGILSYEIPQTLSCLSRYPNLELESERKLLDRLTSLNKIGDSGLVSLYIGAYLSEFENKLALPSFTRRNLLAVLSSESSIRTKEALEPLYEAFLEFSKKAPIKLLLTCSNGNSLSLEASLDRIEKINQLFNKGLKPHELARMFQTSEPEVIQEMLEILVDSSDPKELFKLYKRLGRYSLTPSIFTEFLRDYAALQFQESEIKVSVYDFIEKISQTPSQGNTSVFLMSNGIDFLVANRYEKDRPSICKIAASNPLAEAILTLYRSAEQNGDLNKAAVLLMLGVSCTNHQDLSLLITKIKNSSDKTLQPLVEVKDQTVFMLALQKHFKAIVPVKALVAEQIDGKRYSPYELMLENLQDDPELQTLTLRALNLLPDNYKKSLLQVFRLKNRDALTRFCEHAIEFAQHQGFFLILKNPELFSAYREELFNPGELLNNIPEIIRSLDLTKENPYRELAARLLINSTVITAELRAFRDNSNAEDYFQGDLSFDRIIIYGGQFRGANRQRIVDAMGDTPHLLYTIWDRPKSISHFCERDLLIWVCGSASHTDYTKVKKHCAVHAVPLLHYSGSGSSGLAAILEKIRGV
ncbi:MAG: hypothetical protein R3A13_02480 [Bdellovibrionota bacterium]